MWGSCCTLAHILSFLLSCNILLNLAKTPTLSKQDFGMLAAENPPPGPFSTAKKTREKKRG